MSDPVIELRGIVKRYGRHTALHGIDLRIDRDELLVVLGPTGAGKTTLLRTIAGLERPDGGELLIDSTDAIEWPPARRDMAMVFQQFSLYPDWTVRKNLEFPLRAPGRGLTASQIAERIDSAAAMLRIRHLLEKKANRLSGGEMQRVAIGRAIVRRPRLFLLDEPLTNLDAKLRESLRVELACLRRELGAPMIYVTHDQAEAMSMADRIVILSAGRILQQGAPASVYRNPVSPSVGLQLGQPHINIMDVMRDEQGWISPVNGMRFEANGWVGQSGKVGIRPEDIDPEGGPHAARVILVESMGPLRILQVDWSGVTIHLTAPNAFEVRPGETIHPRPRIERIVFWPASTG